jgi:hypothetical protein
MATAIDGDGYDFQVTGTFFRSGLLPYSYYMFNRRPYVLTDGSPDNEHNNNKMERMNGEIRQREKVIRGLKKQDTVVQKGYQLYHNYFREHEGLKGKTPAEIAGIKIEGGNKWVTIIQNAVHEKQLSKI